jgi:hypothetical protein
LALLAPDIVEAVHAGRTDQALVLEKLERPLPASWEEQRRRLIAQMGTLDPIAPSAAASQMVDCELPGLMSLPAYVT